MRYKLKELKSVAFQLMFNCAPSVNTSVGPFGDKNAPDEYEGAEGARYEYVGELDCERAITEKQRSKRIVCTDLEHSANKWECIIARLIGLGRLEV